MSVPSAEAEARSLETLAAEIKHTHTDYLNANRRSLEHAITAGKLLLEAKAQLNQHGTWLPWLKEHVNIPERTCRHYMRLAEHPELTKSATLADLTVRAALASVRKKGSVEYYTPQHYVEAARRVLGTIDLDPASCLEANKVVQATKFFTQADDGLKHEWHGRIWLNPPYNGQSGKFVDKLFTEHSAGRVEAAIVLVNAHTDAAWFQPLWGGALCFVDHRVVFGGDKPLHPSVIAYIGPHRAAFAREFSEFGAVMVRYLFPDARRGK